MAQLLSCKSGAQIMTDPNTYRRPAFSNRPWITGKLYDDLSRKTVLHCDAYCFVLNARDYLQLEWREGGKDVVALDTWLIEPSGLTPVWDTHRSLGVLTYNRDAGIHARVVQQASAALVDARWTRVSLLAHYIDAREIDAEIRANAYTQRKEYAPRTYVGKLPDIL